LTDRDANYNLFQPNQFTGVKEKSWAEDQSPPNHMHDGEK